jgi:hypothetical protein
MFCPQLFAHSPSPLAVPHAHLLPYYLHASWSQHEFWHPPMIISTIARHPFVKLQKHDYCTIYVLPRSECLFSPSLVPYGHCFHWYGSSFDDLRCTLHNHELGAKPHAHNRFRHSLRILPKIRLLFCDFSSIIYFASRIGFFAPIIHLQIRVPLRFHFSFLPFPALYIIVGERRHCYTNEKTRPSYFVTIPDYLFRCQDYILPSSNLLPCNILSADLPFSRTSPYDDLPRISTQRQLTVPTPNDDFADNHTKQQHQNQIRKTNV